MNFRGFLFRVKTDLSENRGKIYPGLPNSNQYPTEDFNEHLFTFYSFHK